MNEPLAYRVRPKTLEEYVGQEHVLGKDKILYRTIKADRLSSLILFGPPGCGKTSLAQVISETTKYKFYKINAVTAGVADIKAVIEETKNFMLNPAGKAILFIDEIHRFNKLQQDALLPYVENGTIILIGATTENPYFEVNKALISRSMVVKLEPLTQEDIFKVLKMALTKKEGLGEYNIKIEDETLEKLSNISGGDVRTALNALEIATLTTSMNENGAIVINTTKSEEYLKKNLKGYQGDIYTIDARKISEEALGRYFPNTPMLAAIVKVSKVMTDEALLEDMKSSFKHKIERSREREEDYSSSSSKFSIDSVLVDKIHDIAEKERKKKRINNSDSLKKLSKRKKEKENL